MTTIINPPVDPRIKMLEDQHRLWLANPVTTEMFKQLDRYSRIFEQQLIDRIKTTSNKELDDRDRASIRTCQTLKQGFSDTKTFVTMITTKE